MTAPALQRQPGPDRLRTPAPPAAPSGRFSWRVVAACGWCSAACSWTGGSTIRDPGLESVFTPRHALLHSGVAATVVVHLREHRAAGGMRPGCGLSLA